MERPGASLDVAIQSVDVPDTSIPDIMAETEEVRELPVPVETSRGTYRPASRATLQPSVHDFNGNIINKAVDEDPGVWAVGKSYGSAKYHAALQQTDFAYSVPGFFRRGGSFNPVHWNTSRALPRSNGGANGVNNGLKSERVNNGFKAERVNNGFKSERINAWAEEAHRRHVARTARVRARLSPTKSRAGATGDRVILKPSPSGISGRGVSGLPYDNDCSFTLSLPDNGADRQDLEDIRLTSFSRMSSRNGGGGAEQPMTTRSRPATTGRYFDSSNGLRNIRTSQAVFRSRPSTANPTGQSGPGLKIKRITLHYKDELLT